MHAVGDRGHLELGEHGLGDIGVTQRDAVDKSGEGHAEHRHVQLVVLETAERIEVGGHGLPEYLLDDCSREDVVAGRHGGMGGEHTAGADRRSVIGRRGGERRAGPLCQQRQGEEGGVALVHVVLGYLVMTERF